MKQLSWLTGGLLLGLLSVIAIGLVKPLGVSTQYVIFNGMLANLVNPEFVLENSYMAKYASKLSPFGYGFLLVIGMFFGALASRLTGRPNTTTDQNNLPSMWQNRFGPHQRLRSTQAFIGGFLLLFGARLAGGCTSGHMVAGISQLSVSGMIFGAAVMTAGIVTARVIYRQKGGLS
jgi:uncharacterized membrane protein YedE/YeeE